MTTHAIDGRAGMEPADDGRRPLDVMCDEIVERYHAALRRSLPRIRDELAHLYATATSPPILRLATAFGELAELIEAHLAKEENLLFPALEALANAERMGRSRPPLPFVTVLHPIRLMEAEHVRIELALDRLRELVLAVSEPDTLSASWHQCMAELSHLDDDLREHHRTENEHLFPQALELERRIL
jgi:regulator of cell morphogenesis and NO signaling